MRQMTQVSATAAEAALRPHHAADRARRAARHPERDGGGDRAHGHVAVHSREERLLCRPVRRCRPADRRLEPARVRRRGRADRRALPARHHAPGRHLLVQRLLRLQGRRLALARPGVRGARVRRRQARRVRAELGAFQRHRRHAPGLAVARLHGHLPGGHHRAAGAGGARGRGRRGAAAAVLPQLALPRDGQGRHARLHGRDPAGRAAPRRAVPALRPRADDGRLRAADRGDRARAAPEAEGAGPRRPARLHRHHRQRRPGSRAHQAALSPRGDGRAHHARHQRQRRPGAGSRQLPDEPAGAGDGVRLLPPGRGLREHPQRRRPDVRSTRWWCVRARSCSPYGRRRSACAASP